MKQREVIKQLGYLVIFFVSIPLCAQKIESATKTNPTVPEIVLPEPIQPPAKMENKVATQTPQQPSVLPKTQEPTPKEKTVTTVLPAKEQEETKKVVEPTVPEKKEDEKQKKEKEAVATEVKKAPDSKGSKEKETKEAQQKLSAPSEKKEKAEILPTPPALAPESQVEKEEVKEPTEETKKVEKPTATFEEEGIDTYELEGGNWLLKRQALEKTMDVIEKIKDVFTKILESRIDYLVKRNKTDRAVDLFSNKIGFELGDLNQLLKTLSTQLKAERKEEGDLSEEERAVLADVESKIVEIKALRSTLNSITDMDASLDDAIMQLEKEINTSNSYQTRAWKNFQTIKKVLSDEKAEELYLQTESLLKNMQEILNYLKGDLLTYFNSVIDTLKQDMAKAEDTIKALATKGINLQDEVEKIRKAEKLARKKKSDQKEEEQKEAPKAPVKVKKDTWFDTISVIWTYPLSIVTNVWDYITSFFVTKKVVPKKTGETPEPQRAEERKDLKSKVDEEERKK